MEATAQPDKLHGPAPTGDRDGASLAAKSFLEFVDGEGLARILPDFGLASFAECQRRSAYLGYDSDDRGTLAFVCCDPSDLDMLQWFEPVLEREGARAVRRILVTPAAFAAVLAREEGSLRAMDGFPGAELANSPNERATGLLRLSLSTIEATANPVVRLVNSTFYDALKLNASDIHMELHDKTLEVKYRLDGVLQSITRIDSIETAHQAISRIKVLADLDIAERRVPQDGRFRVLLDEREIDFRVSIMPNLTGEDAVLRILDRKHLTGDAHALTLDALRFEEEVKGFIRHASRLPYGLLLVTGPTGSGKTTTLYAAISEINKGLDKIVTIEDPIEYQLPGVLQIPVNEKKGLTFAKGLRSILRHDPDKIMVGEIRDSETAQIAVQAALTGHQVFTTVHANNVFDVIGRFSNMGVDSYSLVAALSGIMAQRLVRTVCPHCAKPLRPGQEEANSLGMTLAEIGFGRLVQPVGCVHCRGTGYRGRSAIAETLPMDDEIKDLLVERAPVSAIKNAARAKSFRSLRDSAVSLALRGMTTVEEINRVTPVQ